MDDDNDLLNESYESYESMTQVDPLSLLLSVKTSNHVYVKSDEYAWVPARLLESDGEKATVSIPLYRDEQAIQSDGGRGSKTSSKVVVELKDYPTRALYLQNVDEEGNLREVEDMVDLPFLHEVCVDGSDFFFFEPSLFSQAVICLGCYSLQPQVSPQARKTLHEDR